jgi:replicative DNA helicase
MTRDYQKEKQDRIANDVLTRAMPSNPVLELEAIARLLDAPSYIYEEYMGKLTEDDFHEYPEVFSIVKHRAIENKGTSIGIINSELTAVGLPVLSEDDEDRLEQSDTRSDTYELVKEIKKLSKSRQYVALASDIQRYGFARKPGKASARLDEFITRRNRETGDDRNKSGALLEDEMNDYLFSEHTFSAVPMFGKTLQETIGGFPLGVVSTILARPSMGKALEDNEKVLTNQGWVKISKLNPDIHKVYGSDGKTHDLLGVYPQGEKDMYIVAFDDGTSIKACGEHLWTVIKDDRVHMQTYTTEQLQEKIKLRGRSFKLPPAPLIHKLTKNLPIGASPYLLGAFVARGDVISSKEYTLYGARQEVMQKLAGLLSTLGGEIGVRYTVRYGKRVYRIELSPENKFMAAVDKEYREYGNDSIYAIKKRILKRVIHLSLQQRLEFLRGMCDISGVWIKGGMIEVQAPHTALGVSGLGLLLEVVRSCGFKATTAGNKVSQSKHSIRIHQCFHDEGVAESGKPMPPRLYENSVMLKTRANEHARKILDSDRDIGKIYPYRKNVVSVTPAERASCTCISVSALDKLFVASGYCLTHNTRFLLASALYAAKWAEATAPGRYYVKYLSQDGDPKSIVSGYCVARYGYELKAWFKGVKESTIPQNIIDAVRRDLRYIGTLPLSFNDESQMTPLRMTGILQRHSDRTGRTPLLVIGDYLQSYHPNEGTRYSSRTERIAITMEQFYEATRTANTYALCMATQLPKEVDQRTDKRPQMGDGKGASEIEEKSEVMIGLYRESYYTKKEDNAGEVLGLKIKTGEKNTTVTMGFQHGLWIPRGGLSSHVTNDVDIHSLYSADYSSYSGEEESELLV